MRHPKRYHFAILAVVVLFSNPLYGWGERGHDIVARLAARLIIAQGDEKLSTPFVQKEHLLGHLAYVPDAVWRASYQSQAVIAANAPTHFINYDKVYPTCAYDSVEKDIAKFAAAAKSKKHDLFIEIGTAPWRVNQLFDMMVADFKAAKRAKGNKKRFTKAVNQALLHAGIMAHVVGDLANPMHTTGDYDGWDRGQGGFHKYFETDVVDAFALGFIGDVQAYALLKRPYKGNIAKVLGKDAKDGANYGLNVAFALVCDSNARLQAVFDLDKRHSLKKRSRKVGISKVEAERHPPGQVKDHFRSFVVERLATGAAVLSAVWVKAWEEGGKPDMSTYASYEYPVKPDFIFPNYTPKPRKGSKS